MPAGGKTPARSGRRIRRGGHRWSKQRRNNPPPLHLSPKAAAAAPEDATLPPGTEVEVRVDDDGFHGSWFEATVVDFFPAPSRSVTARYKVTYSHLLADEGGGVLSEHFAPSHIRPRPPPPPVPSSFRLHDIVEAFHNDGWWSGIVTVAPADPDATVTVAFPITREVISFLPTIVRPRRDYIAGEWVPSVAVIAVKPKRAVKVYKVGEKVEVVRDREEFGYSWFPATVTKIVDPLSYIVDYFDQEDQEVEGEDEEKATEYLHWRFLRPAVEHVPLQSEFQLRPGAAVEAYCDGAWSPGIVRSIVGIGEYEVSVNGKNGEVLVTNVAELLKPQYKWNGKKWSIVRAKRQANLWSRSMFGRSPSSPGYVASSGDEHSHDCGSSAIKNSRSATKRPRKEHRQQELVSGEGLVNVTISEMNIPLSTLSSKSKRFKGSHCARSSMDEKAENTMKPSSLALEVTEPQQQLHITVEDTLSLNKAASQELLPMVPPGFESVYNIQGISKHDTLLEEEPIGMDMTTCQGNRNDDMPTDRAFTQVAKTNSLAEASVQPLESLVQQDGSKVDDRSILLPLETIRSSDCTTCNALFGSCLVADSCTPSQLALCQNSDYKGPFVKTSPCLAGAEAFDILKEQQPHFHPLLEFVPPLRKGMAIGLKLAFVNLVEEVRKSSIGDSMASFENNIKALDHLERNGFSAPYIRSCLNNLLRIKSAHVKYLEEKEDLKAQIVEKTTSSSQKKLLLDENEKAMEELRQAMEELRQKGQQIAMEKEHEDAEVSILKVADRNVEEACGDAEREFHSVLTEMLEQNLT